jgi:hypothetical protein
MSGKKQAAPPTGEVGGAAYFVVYWGLTGPRLMVQIISARPVVAARLNKWAVVNWMGVKRTSCTAAERNHNV